MVFHDRPAQSSAKLVPLEGRDWLGRIIEVVLGIELAVTEELVGAAVNLVCPRSRNRVDHAPRGLPIIRLIVAGDDGELLDRVDAQAPSQHAAGCSVGVIVETDAVQAIVVLLRTRARDRQLLPESAIAAIRARRKIRLRVNRTDAGL